MNEDSKQCPKNTTAIDHTISLLNVPTIKGESQDWYSKTASRGTSAVKNFLDQLLTIIQSKDCKCIVRTKKVKNRWRPILDGKSPNNHIKPKHPKTWDVCLMPNNYSIMC